MRKLLPGDVVVRTGVVYFIFARLKHDPDDIVWCCAVTRSRSLRWDWWPARFLEEEGW